MIIEMLDRWHRPATVEVNVRRDTVELRCEDTIVGIANRDFLHAWLRNPDSPYVYDETTWLPMGFGDVALAIDDRIPAWCLSRSILNNLKALV
jgi:hypothetical protein